MIIIIIIIIMIKIISKFVGGGGISESSGLKSYAQVNLKVLDINDNAPELTNGSRVYICESDKPGTVRSRLNTFHMNKCIMIFL